ncbi:18387_t:CDS:1, partial [Racocetra persica]
TSIALRSREDMVNMSKPKTKLTKKSPITNIASENITPKNVTSKNVTPKTSNNIIVNQQKETLKNRCNDSLKGTYK